MEQNEAHGVIEVTLADTGLPAFAEGIRPGDFILAVNEHEVGTGMTAMDLVEHIVACKQLKKPVKVTVMRKK